MYSCSMYLNLYCFVLFKNILGGGSDVLADPFSQMEPEELEKLETALQSEQAKQILGENVTAMLG